MSPENSKAPPPAPTVPEFGELAGEPPHPSRIRLWLWRLATILALGVVLYVFRAPILRGAARAYVVDEPAVKADAIVVLGGGANTRPFAAARLFHEGYSQHVLVMNTEREPTDALGVTTPESDVNRRVLRAMKVPDAAVVMVGREVSSTHDEALAVREWVQGNGAKQILVPTDLFHTRRVKWLFNRTLAPLNAEVRVRAIPQRKYSTTNWWQHEEGLVDFQNELLKFALYRWKY